MLIPVLNQFHAFIPHPISQVFALGTGRQIVESVGGEIALGRLAMVSSGNIDIKALILGIMRNILSQVPFTNEHGLVPVFTEGFTQRLLFQW